MSHCELINPTALFEMYWRKMAERWLRNYPEQESKMICKAWIRRRVLANYGNISDPLFDDLPPNQHVPPETLEPLTSDEEAAAKKATTEAAQGICYASLSIFL
jgi:hypothetical protein